jgi:hypothetical protein
MDGAGALVDQFVGNGVVGGIAFHVDGVEFVDIKSQFLRGIHIKLENAHYPAHGLAPGRAVTVDIELGTVRDEFVFQLDDFNVDIHCHSLPGSRSDVVFQRVFAEYMNIIVKAVPRLDMIKNFGSV